MKKFLTVLIICMLVLSIMVALVSCRPDNPEEPSTDNPTTDGGNEPVEGGSGTSGGKIELPPVKVPGLTPEPEE